MSKFISREPRDFVKFFRELAAEKSVVLHSGGLRGLVAETTDRPDRPKETTHELKVTQEAVVTVIKILAAVRQGRPVKMVPDKKSWIVYFGPTR